MPDWVFVPALGLYYDPESGRYVGPDDLQDVAFESIDLGKDAVAGISDALIDGTIDLGDWQEAMRQEIMDEYTRQYLAGVGGEENMRDRDWDRLNALIEEQYAYLDAFAQSIAAGDLTPGQIEARAQMYIDSAQQAYWAGVQSAKEMPDLPAMPGDGSTRCMTNCRCGWHIEETEAGWDCTWVVDPASESCSDCLERGRDWNPLAIPAAD